MHPVIKPGSRLLNGAPGSRAVEDLALALENIVIDEDDHSDAENWMEVYSPKKNRFTYTLSFDLDLSDLPPQSSGRKSTFSKRKSSLRRKASTASALHRDDTKISMDIGKRYKHPRLPPPALPLLRVPIPNTAMSSSSSSAGLSTAISSAAMSSAAPSTSTSEDSSLSADLSSFDCTENTRMYRSRNTSAFKLRSKLDTLNLSSAPANSKARAMASPRTPRARHRGKHFIPPCSPLGVPVDVSHFPLSPISPQQTRRNNVVRVLPPKSPKAVRNYRVRPPGLSNAHKHSQHSHVVSPNHTRTSFVHPRVRVAAGPRPLLSASNSAVQTPTAKVLADIKPATPAVPDNVSAMVTETPAPNACNSTPRRPPRGPRPTPPRKSSSPPRKASMANLADC